MMIKSLAHSLKFKLYGFVFLAIFLVFALVGAGIHYYRNIEEANNTKADFNQLVKKMQDTRGAEKTYLQFFTPELKDQFGDFVHKTEAAFATVNDKRNTAQVMQHLASAQDLIGK
jgi:hypothetical protein